MLGCYACWVVVVLIEERTIPAKSAQILLAFVPPIALQLGCGSFLNSWDGISIQMITGILVSNGIDRLTNGLQS